MLKGVFDCSFSNGLSMLNTFRPHPTHVANVGNSRFPMRCQQLFIRLYQQQFCLDVLFPVERAAWQSAVAVTTYIPQVLSSALEHRLPYVYKASMSTSTARLVPIETCRFVFPSSLHLMGAVVITACRPSGISGLILVPTPQATGSFCVSPGFVTRGKLNMEEYLQITEICMDVPLKKDRSV